MDKQTHSEISSTPKPKPTEIASPKEMNFLEKMVLAFRLILVPFLVGLSIALLFLGQQFVLDLQWLHADTAHIKTHVYLLLEDLMQVQLVVTTVIGGYHIYIKPIATDKRLLQSWLRNMTAEGLKIQISESIAMVTGIGLLEDYQMEDVTQWELEKHLAIHFTFLISAIVLKHIKQH